MQAAMTGYAAAGPNSAVVRDGPAAEWDAHSPLQLLVPWCRSVLLPLVVSVAYTPQCMWSQHSHRTAVTARQPVQRPDAAARLGSAVPRLALWGSSALPGSPQQLAAVLWFMRKACR
jgi:hypothetical protein